MVDLKHSGRSLICNKNKNGPKIEPFGTLQVIVFLDDSCSLKPVAHLRKELGKLPREAVSSAVSSRVRGNCGEKFASRGREDKIKYV